MTEHETFAANRLNSRYRCIAAGRAEEANARFGSI